jgi:type I restriction enzyme S subunit
MEIRPGYKQTEVGVIPEDWDASILDKICSMKSGEGITAEQIDSSSLYPCFGGNGIRGYTSRFNHDGEFALIGRQGALCGNVVGVSGKFFASEHAVVVTPRAGTNIQFLTYVLGELRLNRFSESSAQPGLSVSKILPLPVAAPKSEGEQRAIAEALRDVDALLSGLDRLIAKKRDLKQAAMQQLLTGQTRLLGFQGEWEVKTLGRVLRFQVGFPFSSAFFNEKQQGIRLVKNRDLKSDDQVFHYSGAYDSAFLVKNGDVLVGMDGDFLPCLWSKGTALLNQRVGRIIPLAGLNLQFAYYYLLEPLKEIEIATAGTTVKHLSHGDIEGIEKPLPSVPEQTAIANVLSDMDDELAALEARRDKTRLLKQGMMQELLTGRTRLV